MVDQHQDGSDDDRHEQGSGNDTLMGYVLEIKSLMLFHRVHKSVLKHAHRGVTAATPTTKPNGGGPVVGGCLAPAGKKDGSWRESLREKSGNLQLWLRPREWHWATKPLV